MRSPKVFPPGFKFRISCFALRIPELLPDGWLDELRHLVEHGICHVRERCGRAANVRLAEQITYSDAEEFLVLEAMQNGGRIAGAAAEFGQFRSQFLRRARLVEDEAVEQFVDHARVVDE